MLRTECKNGILFSPRPHQPDNTQVSTPRVLKCECSLDQDLTAAGKRQKNKIKLVRWQFQKLHEQKHFTVFTWFE